MLKVMLFFTFFWPKSGKVFYFDVHGNINKDWRNSSLCNIIIYASNYLVMNGNWY